MKAVVQRVSGATLDCDGKRISEIGKGLVAFFGVAAGEQNQNAEKSLKLAKKIAALRVFEDENGKMNLSVKDVCGEILCVSQFTLLADVSHGNRPGFTGAEKPEIASKVYDDFCVMLAAEGVPVKKGVFGGDMKIAQINDGPITIIYEM